MIIEDPSRQTAIDILDGKVPPCDPYAAHMVDRYQEIRREGDQLVAAIEKTSQQLNGFRQRLMEVRGATKAYVSDLTSWLEKRDFKPAVPAAPVFVDPPNEDPPPVELAKVEPPKIESRERLTQKEKKG